MTAARQRFKYLSYSVRSGRLLAIDLWKSGPPVKAAEIVRGRGGCLTLERFRVNTGMASASGRRQTQPEPRFAVIVRGADGNLLGRVVKTRSGAWTARVTYRTPRRQPGTLEASAASPKDGSLACLVQRRVWLPATVGGVVRSFRWGIDELGFWHIGGRGHGTYPAAVAALGSPSDLRQRGNGSCVAGWPGLGLRIRFTTFGAASGCESLFAQEGTISGVAGRSRWRTTRGLRVGDSVARLDRAYPHAIRLPAARVLEWASPSPYGTGRLDLITATLARGHVTSLRLFIGASGD
jgi:hypothetical protein